jgi:MFS family permease
MRRKLVDGLRRAIPRSRESRTMAAASLVASLAFGMYTSGSVVYFTRYVGLPATQVGLGLTLAGLLWLPLSVFIGRFSDRVGARKATLITGALQVALLLLATQVRTPAQFFVLVALLGAAEQGGWVCREALVADIAEREERVGAAALLRSLFNLGVIAGSLLGGVALSLDSRSACLTLILGTALASALATCVYARLPETERTADASGSGFLRQALTDHPYLALALLCGVLAMGDSILVIGVPLWIVTHSTLPHGLAAWLFGLNSLLVVVLQVRVSRGATTLPGARRLLVRAGFALGGACVLIALSRRQPGPVVVGCLLLAVVLLTLGELWSSAASWKFRYDLAPEPAQGVYGGLFALGSSVHLVLGPVLVTGLTQRLLDVGWLSVAAGFAAVSLAAGPAVTWAARTRSTESGGLPVMTAQTMAEVP